MYEGIMTCSLSYERWYSTYSYTPGNDLERVEMGYNEANANNSCYFIISCGTVYMIQVPTTG